MQKDDENSIWFEVLQFLSKIEKNTEGLNKKMTRRNNDVYTIS